MREIKVILFFHCFHYCMVYLIGYSYELMWLPYKYRILGGQSKITKVCHLHAHFSHSDNFIKCLICKQTKPVCHSFPHLQDSCRSQVKPQTKVISIISEKCHNFIPLSTLSIQKQPLVMKLSLCSFFSLRPFPPVSLGFIYSLDSLFRPPLQTDGESICPSTVIRGVPGTQTTVIATLPLLSLTQSI